MTRVSLAAAAAILLLSIPTAQAGPISRACLASDRAGSTALCGCIQHVANGMLSWSDQRMAARFFKDPDQAQKVRMSDNLNHEAFWLKYKAFGQAAAAQCS
ncbi:hypothetical protein [Pseudooceanicola aestuarii]|uniref:hypothetical protein n=1 Tax=Pseudooceanicola aestuarii TaxID=2697319 RepID=UPI0013D81F70|nr:hypothetical protein [Pseudooceanicola aestuarii]